MRNYLTVLVILAVNYECWAQLPKIGEFLSGAHEHIQSHVNSVANTVLGGLSHGINLNLGGHFGIRGPPLHRPPTPHPPNNDQQNEHETIVVVVEETTENNYGLPQHPSHNGYGQPHQRPGYNQRPHNNGYHNHNRPDNNGNNPHQNGYVPDDNNGNYENPHGQRHHNQNGQQFPGQVGQQYPNQNGRPFPAQNHNQNGQQLPNQNGDYQYNNYGNPNSNIPNQDYEKPSTESATKFTQESATNIPDQVKPTYGGVYKPENPDKDNEKASENTTAKPDDTPLFVPLNPDQYNYGGDKITINAPKREADKVNPDEESSDDFDIDIRFQDK